jgi:hypothetical protein
LFEKFDWKTLLRVQLQGFWDRNKPVLIFGSARKHAKNMDWFVPLVMDFLKLVKRQPCDWLWQLTRGHNAAESYKLVYDQVSKIKYTGRFASDLFLEMLVAFSKAGFILVDFQEPETLDWKNCSNLTSGLFNILYMDEEADLYDKTGYVAPEHIPLLNKRIRQVQRAIQKTYPEQDASLPLVIGKICSFRNLFKSNRYGGFHHDRQLENILLYRVRCREAHMLWEELFEIREKLFDKQLLGELNGWRGVRKERKKLWLQEGLTGVESIGEH